LPNQTNPTFDIAAFLAALGPILAKYLGGDGVVGAYGTRSGTFNRVIKFDYGGRHLGVRVAFDLQHFRYERNIIKEVFAISLLEHAGQPMDDERIRHVVDGLMAKPKGADLAHEWVRPVLYYDWSMLDLPFPFFIFEWIDGNVLWEQPFADHYHRSGKMLAGLHRVRFENFYENIFAIHHYPRSWRDHLRVCFNRELARAELTLPEKLLQHLQSVDLSKLTPGGACLVHNDFSGANVVIDQQGAPHVIDWDNWVVDCPELDLVKMKYWTAIGRDGHLTYRSGLYDAFLQGYKEASDQPVDEGRLRAYEYLWLLRCFNFENSRESAGGLPVTEAATPNSWRQVYPDARYYRDLLQDL
jgi:hypothetical protein